MIADDDPLIRALVTRSLRRDKITCYAVADGDAALEAGRALVPDVLLLDWLMPGRNGVEVCRLIKEDSITHDIHVVMVTSRGDEAQLRAAFAAGADDYVTKPFDVNDIVAVVRRLLEVR